MYLYSAGFLLIAFFAFFIFSSSLSPSVLVFGRAEYSASPATHSLRSKHSAHVIFVTSTPLEDEVIQQQGALYFFFLSPCVFCSLTVGNRCHH